MKQHQYHITVEHLRDAKGQPSTYTEKLAFDVGNHDDILAIVARMQQAKLFDADATAAFAVGLSCLVKPYWKTANIPYFSNFCRSLVSL